MTHNIIMILGDWLGLSLFAGAAVSFAVVVVLGYALHSRFTFATAPSWLRFLRYTLAMAANLPLSITLLWVLIDHFGLEMWFAAPLATAGVIAANFILSRWAMGALDCNNAITNEPAG